jgi:phage terminase large subunit-like protein
VLVARRTRPYDRLVVGSDAPLALDRAERDAVFGLTVRDRAILLHDTDTSAELPVGWADAQDAVDHVSRELRCA